MGRSSTTAGHLQSEQTTGLRLHQPSRDIQSNGKSEALQLHESRFGPTPASCCQGLFCEDVAGEPNECNLRHSHLVVVVSSVRQKPLLLSLRGKYSTDELCDAVKTVWNSMTDS